MELWDAYDENGVKQLRTLVRGEPIPEGLYHLVSCILVRHRDGSYLLLLRSPEKEVHPNVWEIGAAGSALQGESSAACARRELLEETGIDDDRLTFLDRVVDWETRAIYDGYLCVTDRREIRLQPGENCQYQWISRQSFLDFYHSEACVPRIRRRLQNYVNRLENPVDEGQII